jgi:excisionase family DNA binding protein
VADIPFRERITCSVNEAAKALGIGRSKTYELIAARRIRTVRPDGGRQLVVVESLLALARTPEGGA